MWADIVSVAAKDLRIEWRSKVLVNQALPFGVVMLVLFAFAFDDPQSTTVFRPATAGLYWVAVVFTAILAAQRAALVETGDGVRDQLALSGLEPAALFLGKAAALAVEIAVIQLVLLAGVGLLYPVDLRAAGWPVMLVTWIATTVALAGASTIYGALVAGLDVRDSLLPLLVLPAVTPIFLGATRAFEAAFATNAGRGGPSTVNAADGWPWVGLIAVFALVYVGAGLLAYGPTLEDS